MHAFILQTGPVHGFGSVLMVCKSTHNIHSLEWNSFSDECLLTVQCLSERNNSKTGRETFMNINISGAALKYKDPLYCTSRHNNKHFEAFNSVHFLQSISSFYSNQMHILRYIHTVITYHLQHSYNKTN